MARLETQRLILRSFAENDLDDLHHFAQNPKLGKMAGWQPHSGLGESQAILTLFIRSDEVFALELKETHHVIGSIGLHRRAPSGSTPEDSERELGFVLDEDYWGQGLMPEAIMGILAFGFNHLHLMTIWVGHFASNRQSKRVIEKTGFHFEYELERPKLFADDAPVTECYYKLTVTDYRAQQAKLENS
ncbi:GNAT family N-acetyltransferase [Loigolactobacillus backii]|uniref:GNAT family N-acetyltransferase n=1 Tax=Loigolactobacillus backii TaxID=375175 RepID=UPI0007F0D36D|nr:GNAT family N-acetyltransferase [Loigolactobacillus backii]ANK65057.1 GCN5 family acetyltransferase [Loigolactobacillus backii]ANK67613.1 GCN5 family acetyltransferase [Loigolactobacillus backii]MDA5387851.1 GNAT family N-acetyltransferase [Loigolactobacillus backii]MDA5390365.1 GNAT family N-acetyltransferase [Loigolactobacillus backii]OLF68060.1 GCN5 family acetyltransferase [Loigolactobacillus backii]